MYKDVLKNLIESIDEPQLINTAVKELEPFFNGKHVLHVAHGFVRLEDIATYIEMLVMNNGWFLGDIWVNLKGNINMRFVSDLMFEINKKNMLDANISVTFDDKEDDIEVSMIVAMPPKTMD